MRKRCDSIGRLSYNWHVLTDEDKQWISERLEKVETTLLTEFHKWASPVELRSRSHAAALRALDAEVESLADRLKNPEGYVRNARLRLQPSEWLGKPGKRTGIANGCATGGA